MQPARDLGMEQLLEGYARKLTEVDQHQPTTIELYTSVATEFVVALSSARISLSSFDERVVECFLGETSKTKHGPSPVIFNRRLAALRSFCKYLKKEKVIMVNPALEVDRAKLFSAERLPITLDDYFQLLREARSSTPLYRTRNVAILETFLSSGPRVAELVSLKVTKLDLQEHLFLDVKLKGGKFRSKSFSDRCAAAIEAYLPDREKLNPKPGVDELFITDRGGPMAVRTVQALIQGWAKAAGIVRPATPHVMRHSLATELAKLRVHFDVIGGILDHETVETTKGYVHLEPVLGHEAIHTLGRHIDEAEVVWDEENG